MPTHWTAKQLAVLVAAGMVLLFVGVVVGSYTGTILRGNAPSPLLVGTENRANREVTTLTTNTTSGSVLTVDQTGTGTAVKGESSMGTGGIFVADDKDRSGLLAQNTAGSQGEGAALTADGNHNTGIHGISALGVGIWAQGGQAALYADGAVQISGDLSVDGGCLGCSVSVLALNDSTEILRPGNAVTITGATRDDQGTLLVSVAPARRGDRVIGIVASAMHLEKVSVGGQTVHRYGPVEGTILPNGTLRVQTDGLVAEARADASTGQTAAGDSLGVGDAPGQLVRVDPADPGASVGYALGAIQDGLVPMLISLH